MELSEFLLARIAEDEADYRGAMHLGCVEDDSDGPHVIHSARCPNRVLAECDAKRRIVALHNPCDDWSYGDASTCPELCALALPYADHPDYRNKWKP